MNRKQNSKKAPSPAQIRARKAFAAAAKARAKAAKKKASKAPRKRNKTIIKAHTIKHLDVSKTHNPKRQRNLDHRDAAHPIHVSQYWQGRKGYLTQWQRAHKAGQQGLFEHGIKARNPGAKSFMRFKVDFAVPLYVFIHMETGMTMAEARKDAYTALESDLGKVTHNGYRIIGEGEKVLRLPSNAGPVAGTKRIGKGGKVEYWAYISRRDKTANPTTKKASPAVRKIRKQFTGMESRKTTVMHVPNGTPKNLAKLGRLVSIKTEKGVINPASGVGLVLCSDAKGKLHIASTKPARAKNPAMKQVYGKVKEIEYETAKPHLGYKKKTIFFHQMGEEGGTKPTLFSDGQYLRLRGGSYKIQPEGIVN